MGKKSITDQHGLTFHWLFFSILYSMKGTKTFI